MNATSETACSTVSALHHFLPRLMIAEHEAGSIGIGAARRQALALATRVAASDIVYSDLDHVLRWATAASADMVDAVTEPRLADFVVIGRSEKAWQAEPERPRQTERMVNRVASLALGLDERWDFMIAVRRMSLPAAILLVNECDEDSVANDVVWPLLVADRGLTTAYRAVDGLAFRARDDFGSARDDRDSDVHEWSKRVEMAGEHVRAMKQFV